MRLLTAGELERLATAAGLTVSGQREIPLPTGKRLLEMYLRRAAW